LSILDRQKEKAVPVLEREGLLEESRKEPPPCGRGKGKRGFVSTRGKMGLQVVWRGVKLKPLGRERNRLLNLWKGKEGNCQAGKKKKISRQKRQKKGVRPKREKPL